ncbi:T9SS type A sorting domain-containing protein [bacterium]|nr:T9SS type A sorting domain-containing protein [bacterium]
MRIKIARVVWITLLIFCIGKVTAQTPFTAKKLPLEKISKVSTLYPMEVTTDWYPYLKNTYRAPLAGSKANQERIEEKKEAANRARDKATPVDPTLQRTSTADAPVYVSGFLGNNQHLGNPNDNDMAISKGGKIVSVVNTDISAYLPDGTLIFSMSLEGFTPGTGNNQKFDPRILYDRRHDRFIFSCLNGFNPANSEVIIAFSSSNDPSDPWNIYSFDGGLTVNGVPVWADFPQIGVTRDELFLEANLFDGSSAVGSGQGSIVWQIELAGGYAGNTLVVQPHTLQGTFSIAPVHGAETSYGPNFFFIDDIGGGGDIKIFLLEIDNTIANGGSFKTPVTLNSPLNYRLSPGGVQFGSSLPLRTGDCRVHSAYIVDDKIYFAFNARVNNRAGIFFGKIGLSPIAPTFSSLETMLIGSSDYDYAYPRLAYGGCTSQAGEHSTLMVVNLAPRDTFPGCGVIHIDTLGEASDPTICVLGEQPLGLLSRGLSTWNWGDYTGISSPNPGEVWTSAYFVPADSSNKTWISRVHNPACAELGPPSAIGNSTQPVETKVYPNPATFQVFVEFEVEISGIYTARIIDATGREVHTLINGFLAKGKAKAGMSTLPLSRGLYFLSIEHEGNVVAKKKIVVGR